MTDRYVEQILRARVYDIARETPLEQASRLSTRLGRRVWLKREDLQPTFSFKVRGAGNRIAALSDAEMRAGVVAASAGNHAQGVALAAARRGVAATIVMPTTTPEIKVRAVRELDADVVLHGDGYDDACLHAEELRVRDGRIFVHPYDDPLVIAGQGTVGMEILRQAADDLEAIFVPVGGGGLIAGIAAWVRFLAPQVRVIGVEPQGAACLHAALAAGRPVPLDHVDLFADGVAVREVGREPYRVVRGFVDEVVRVSIDEICAAILDLFEDTRTVAEPAGALAVAGLKRFAHDRPPSDGALCAIVSGANMNFHRLRHISERVEIGEGREAILAVTIPERPGSFRHFCEAIGPLGITEFNYRCASGDEAHVFAGVQVHEGSAEREALVERLRASGYEVADLSDNELAKIHARHMVGGRAPLADGERVFTFNFPERPGALRRFLEALGAELDITLFHYRNHGAALGRVLAGLRAPRGDEAALAAFLDRVGYDWVEETDNPAYRLFLR